MRSGRSSQVRQMLVERLRARRGEIELAILTRAHSVSDPTGLGDPAYVEGLRAAVAAGVGYGLAGVEAGSPQPGPIPLELLSQARHAARNGVGLDTVLRRYFAGHTVLGDVIAQEAEESGQLGAEELQALGRAQSALVDRVAEAVSAEYRGEVEARMPTRERRRGECVQRLLAGEFADTAELNYDLDGWHLAAVLAGPGASRAIRGLAAALGCRVLLVERGGGRFWAWLGGRRRIDCSDLEGAAALVDDWPAHLSMAVSEPGEGLAGWRLAHQQAAAALPIAIRGRHRSIRYADVSLLASALQDDVLVRSLENLFLSPLAGERDGGEALRQTLRAYFAAEGNASSAAAALGIGRQTVANRIRVVEMRIGRALNACAAELEAALDLERLGLTRES